MKAYQAYKQGLDSVDTAVTKSAPSRSLIAPPPSPPYCSHTPPPFLPSLILSGQWVYGVHCHEKLATGTCCFQRWPAHVLQWHLLQKLESTFAGKHFRLGAKSYFSLTISVLICTLEASLLASERGWSPVVQHLLCRQESCSQSAHIIWCSENRDQGLTRGEGTLFASRTFFLHSALETKRCM